MLEKDLPSLCRWVSTASAVDAQLPKYHNLGNLCAKLHQDLFRAAVVVQNLGYFLSFEMSINQYITQILWFRWVAKA